MLARHGIDVVGQGASIEDAEHYVLLRSFRSPEERNEKEEAFYESDEVALWAARGNRRAHRELPHGRTTLDPGGRAGACQITLVLEEPS